MTARATLGAGLLLCLVGQAAAQAEPLAPQKQAHTALAIVVGSNRGPSASIAQLRYADDDALANERMARMLGMTTTVLVTLDEETRTLFPALGKPQRASRTNLSEAFATARARTREARARGQSTSLHFFFAGHGDTEAGRPFLQLDDARLWPEDLADGLSTIAADETHVIIDACYGTRFVGTRGPGGQRASLAPGFSTAVGPRWPPRTGFLTARSASGQTHEWAEFQAGIFSHEARSGLIGGADVDDDGRITYRELAAFVTQANAAVPNMKYRPQVVANPPKGDLDATLAILPVGPMALRIDARPTGHTIIETEAGVRLADLHPGPGQDLTLRLPLNMGSLFVQRLRPEAEYRIEPQAHVRLSNLQAAPPRAHARGAAQESFRQLFALPFDRDVAANYTAPTLGVEAWREEVEPSRAQQTWGWATLGVGLASTLAGTAFGISAHMLSNEADGATGLQRSELGDRIDQRNTAATVLISTGLIASAVGAGLLWWQTSQQGTEP